MKDVISTDNAPAAVGPYSQGIKANGFIFTAGQVPLDPDGEAIDGGIERQTRRCLENLRGVLEGGGASLDDVVKVNVYLDDIEDFGDMNNVYQEFFSEDPPARSAVEAGSIPLGLDIEIEAVAVID